MRHPDPSRRRAAQRLLCCGVLYLACASVAHAVTCTSNASGTWSNQSTWTCGNGPGVPNSTNDVIIQGGHTITLDTNTKNLGTLTINSGGVLNGSVGTVYTLLVGKGAGEDFTNNGTINFSGATAATVSLKFASQWAGTGIWNLTTIDSALNTLNFTAGSSFTINLSGAGDPLPNPGAINSPATATTVTWNYNGTLAQTTSSSGNVLYGHLTTNNSAGVTLGRALTTSNLLGNLSVASGMLSDGGFSITGLASRTLSLANGATFVIDYSGGMATGFGSKSFGASSTVNYAAAAAQPVSAETYGNLTVSGGTKTLAGNATVVGTLTLSGGVVTTGANTLITTANCATAVNRTSGWVAGLLQKKIPTGTPVSCTFEVGDATVYRPINTVLASVSGAGSIVGSVSQSGGDHPNIGSSLINSAKSVNRYWTLTNVGTTFTTYSATFNFVAGDVDAGANTAAFIIQRYLASAWNNTTIGTRTAISTQATALTGFGDFAIGEQGVAIDHFAINIGAASASTCTPKSITITAQDVLNNTLTSYTGTINLGTSSGHGDWSNVSANGTLTAGAADSGAASYGFVSADNGVITLGLGDTHADDLTASVVDSVVPSTARSSATINFRDNVFVISNDGIQVAGRNQAMSAALWRKDTNTGNCFIATNYAGIKPLKIWLTRDGSDPGGTAPTINAVSLPNAQPGAANVSLTFTNGTVNFNLSTTDVGKYALNLLDSTRSFASVDISGASNSITTRPFGLAFTNIKQGTTTNPGGANPGDAAFTAAGQAFQATVGAYLWQGADDLNNDGVPDAGANITDNGLAAHFAWPVTLSSALNTPVGGSTGALGGTINILQPSFSSGTATVSDLTYSEVGSFALSAGASNYLNSGIGLSATSVVVGRFTPDHFAVNALQNGSLANGCGIFTYSGQQNGGRGAIRYATVPGFTVTAQNAANVTTKNYKTFASGVFSKLAASGITLNPPTQDGTQTGANLPATKLLLTANLNAGTLTENTGAGQEGTFTYALGNDDFAYTHEANALIGPFTSDIALVIAGIAEPSGNDGVSTAIAGQTLKPTGVEIRFGRLNLQDAYGSELLPLPINLTADYYAGAAVGFVTNTNDGCTGVAATNVTVQPNSPLLSGDTSLTVAANPFVAGSWHVPTSALYSQLSKPASGNQGSVDLAIDLDAAGLSWLKYTWASPTVFSNPTARAVFGIYQGPARRIYMHERFN